VRIAGLGTEEEAASQIKNYPNPLHKGLLHIEGSDIEKIEIFDPVGSRVYEEIVPPNTSQLSINLHPLTKGSYYLKVLTKQHLIVRKLIVN
jgi:hypothetical protein